MAPAAAASLSHDQTDALESLLSSLDPVADFPPTVEPDVELERKRVVH